VREREAKEEVNPFWGLLQLCVN